MKTSRKLLGTLLPLGLLLGACIPTVGGGGPVMPTRYFLLGKETQTLASLESATTSLTPLTVNPVVIPPYLNRPEIVTRDGYNEITLSEYHQWGGSLSDNLSRVLEENLSQLLPGHRLGNGLTPVVDLSGLTLVVRILRFERGVERQVNLTASWRILGDDDGRIKASGHFSKESAAVGYGDYVAVVAAMNDNLTALSQEIAQAIVALDH
ncbi:MAG: membrane integrity-associated transporter subunit PqiC [Magnetococcales bacterium]|nr:membrane integrity-associated transporter subunit PqiC [Magnetococcales bacterium]